VISLDIIGVSRIRFGKRVLTPTSPQLFAIALYLSVESERRIPRSELQSLLFPGVPKQSARSHSLRQLLYRLGSAGFPMESRGDAVWIASSHVHRAIAELKKRSVEERVLLSPSDFEVLPAYSPAISPQFSDWVDCLRSKVSRGIRAVLEEDLAHFQRAYEWAGVAETSQRLLAVEPLHYNAVCALTEASLLRGRPGDALKAVNEYLDEMPDAGSSQHRSIARLKNRIVADMRSPSTAPFVGRSDCMAFLSHAWDSAVAGTMQSVLVSGAAGIGKSRVLAALCDYAVLRGARCVTHTCGSNDRHRPLALFAHAAERLLGLRGALGISPSARSQLARLCDVGPASGLVSTDPISSEVARAELQDAIVDLLDAVCSESPLLLAVDDAHLLDSASWAVLREVSHRVAHRPLLILLCARSAQHPSRPDLPLRLRTFPLARLSEEDSRTLLLALAPERVADAARLAFDLRTSGGNPFLIHALTRFSRRSGGSAAPPPDVTALAASSYYALQADARTLLESVLYLRELASLPRLRIVSQLDEAVFLRSLRSLEEEGLIRLADGGLECSHDLIADALRVLTPQTVAAVLNARIARQLETECVDHRMDPTLAWASAQAWLAAGQPIDAARLIRRCAAHASALGEPVEAARMLGRLLDSPLPANEAVSLTEELIALADAGGERILRARAIEARIALLQEDPHHLRMHVRKELSDLKITQLESVVHDAGDLIPLLATLRRALVDPDLGAEQRVRTAATLLISSDLLYDRDLAHFTWQTTAPLLNDLSSSHPHSLRARLIYHAIFGEAEQAKATALCVFTHFPEPTLEPSTARSRSNALFALHVLGCSGEFHPHALTTFNHMRARKVLTQSIYVANMIAERFTIEGDIEAAIDWLVQVADDVRRVHPTAGGVTPGYYSTLAFAASVCDRLEAASAALNMVQKNLPTIGTPRMRAIDDALWMRLRLLDGNKTESRTSMRALDELYQRGCTYGRQDTIVEALWLAYRTHGDVRRASRLLREYLTTKRRDLGPPEWSLRHMTREDPAWRELSYGPPVAATVGRGSRAKLDGVLDSLVRSI
jgi:DNA-binding SARP family transcriptional activator